MKHLILKDIQVLTMVNVLMPLIWCLLSYNVKLRGDTFYAKTLFYTFLFIMLYAVPFFLGRHDDNSDIDIMLNSLPIDRKDIVKSRYISIAMYMIFIAIGFFTVFNMINPLISRVFGSITINLYDVLFIVGLTLMFLSLYLPFHYFSLGKAQALNERFFMVLILIPGIVMKFSDKLLDIEIINILFNTEFNNFVLTLLGLGTILYILSLQISKQIYQKKEF